MGIVKAGIWRGLQRVLFCIKKQWIEVDPLEEKHEEGKINGKEEEPDGKKKTQEI